MSGLVLVFSLLTSVIGEVDHLLVRRLEPGSPAISGVNLVNPDRPTWCLDLWQFVEKRPVVPCSSPVAQLRPAAVDAAAGPRLPAAVLLGVQGPRGDLEGIASGGGLSVAAQKTLGIARTSLEQDIIMIINMIGSYPCHFVSIIVCVIIELVTSTHKHNVKVVAIL